MIDRDHRCMYKCYKCIWGIELYSEDVKIHVLIFTTQRHWLLGDALPCDFANCGQAKTVVLLSRTDAFHRHDIGVKSVAFRIVSKHP